VRGRHAYLQAGHSEVSGFRLDSDPSCRSVAGAEGGAGLVEIEATSVDYPRSRSVLNPALGDGHYIPMYRRVADGIHRAGSKIVVQLSHVGRQTRRSTTGMMPAAPSPVPSQSSQYPDVPEDLTREGIADIVRKFGAAAKQYGGLKGGRSSARSWSAPLRTPAAPTLR
jgi:hypothetical protein